MKAQASFAAGDRSNILRVLGRRSTFMAPSVNVVGGRHTTPDVEIYVELMQNRRTFPKEMPAGTPHITTVHIRRKMVSATFFAECGRL